MLAGGDLSGGCKQQDAHEFFLFILEMLMSTSSSTSASSSSSGGGGGGDVMSHLFQGRLRSDVVCSCCGAASTTLDQFTHLSLDIPPPSHLVPPPIVPRPNANSVNGKAGAAAAAAAKGGKTLVGAAKAAHLAKMNRLSNSNQHDTPDVSTSQAATAGGGGGGGAVDSMMVDDSGGGNYGTSAMPSVSPGIAYSDAPPRPEQEQEQQHATTASGCDNANAIHDIQSGPTQDTLSSPRRRTRGLIRRYTNTSSSTSPDAAGDDDDDMNDVEQHQEEGENNPTANQIAAETTVQPPSPPPPPHASSPQAPHPSLSLYLHWPGASLSGCLRRFVWPENLGSTTEQWVCSGCGAHDGAVKQLTIAQLPPVLVMHVKRFEHSGGVRAAAKKLDTYLAFPLENLDMKAYLSGEALRERYVARPTAPVQEQEQKQEQGNVDVDVDATTTPAAPPPPHTDFATGAVSTRRTTRSRGHAAPAATSTTPTATTASEKTKESNRVTARTTRSAAATAAALGSTADHIGGMKSVKKTLPVTTPVDNLIAENDDDDDAAAMPSKNLNHTTTTNANALYDVFAVVCHRGSFQGGHYVSYIRASNGQWYLCDDAYVAPVTAEVVKTCQAYILFYGQQGLLPWRGGGNTGGGSSEL